MVIPRERRERLARPESRSLPKKNGRRNSTQQNNTPPPKGKGAARAPEQTFEEVKYLKHLIENAIPVRIKLAEGDEVRGTVEYYDHSFIRITRAGEPNLFIFKHDIKYMTEEGS
jgi:host factor-I protein